MTRVETIGDCTLYLGDCREILPTLGKVDAVVTDPPYGIGKAKWDDAYPEWIESAALEMARAVVIMPGMWALQKSIAALGDAFVGVISGRNLNGMTFGPLGFNNWIPAVCAGDIPRRGMDAFEFVVANEKPDHPSPKPLEYMLKLIARVSEQQWLVADPFMGSGTTGVACVNLGRKFIGIEIEPKYFDIACKRIDEATRQPRLFKEPAATAKQEAMAL